MQLVGPEPFQEEQLHRLLFQQAPKALGMIDLLGRWIDVSDALCRMFGYTRKELIYRRCDDIPQCGHPDESTFRFEQALRRKLNHHAQNKVLLCKDGHPIRISFKMTLVRDDAGQPTCFLIEIEPASVQPAPAAGREEQLVRAYHQKISDAFMLLDRNGIVLDMNETYSIMFGWLPEEVIGQSLPSETETLGSSLLSLMEMAGQGHDVTCYETVKYRKDGSPVDVSVSVVPIFEDTGMIMEFAVIMKDLTLHNKLWKQARESEETFANLLEHSPEPFLVFRNSLCVYANAACLRMLGTDEGDSLEFRTPAQFGCQESAKLLEERVQRAMQGLINGPTELQLFRMDGTVIEVEAVFIPALLNGETYVHVLIRDITERKQTQELFRQSDKMKAVGQMAAGLAHEIRNPLTAIKGFVQLAEMQLPSKSEYFTIIKSEIERIDSITSEMLMLAKPNPSRMKVMDLRGVLKGVSQLLETQAILSNIEIHCRLGEEPGFVLCDENQVKQVFVNLIKNAIEAMKYGGAITVTVCIDRDNAEIVAEVKDEGCGIPEEQIAKIGQPFYTTKEKGTGLGLMVSYKIIENHRGKIEVYSEAGVGTKFRIRLPDAGRQRLNS
ncbi:PAS domain S-box protein [Paenibacillus chartarius]|uniref:histidine kinase n=1 Tax=Paenibacillus chartarius TaxID=747481 RepID=A0ABV6DMQ2_9BACL